MMHYFLFMCVLLNICLALVYCMIDPRTMDVRSFPSIWHNFKASFYIDVHKHIPFKIFKLLKYLLYLVLTGCNKSNSYFPFLL